MKALRHFTLYQRVKVRDDVVDMDPTFCFKALAGKEGEVVRLRKRDNGAWVAMDEPLPDALRVFAADDPHGRGNHVCLYPEYCERVTP